MSQKNAEQPLSKTTDRGVPAALILKHKTWNWPEMSLTKKPKRTLTV